METYFSFRKMTQKVLGMFMLHAVWPDELKFLTAFFQKLRTTLEGAILRFRSNFFYRKMNTLWNQKYEMRDPLYTGISQFPRCWFNAVYNSILFSSPLVLLSNLDLRGFFFPSFLCVPTEHKSRNACICKIGTLVNLLKLWHEKCSESQSFLNCPL